MCKSEAGPGEGTPDWTETLQIRSRAAPSLVTVTGSHEPTQSAATAGASFPVTCVIKLHPLQDSAVPGDCYAVVRTQKCCRNRAELGTTKASSVGDRVLLLAAGRKGDGERQ